MFNLLLATLQMQNLALKLAIFLINSIALTYSIIQLDWNTSDMKMADWVLLLFSGVTLIFMSTKFAFIEDNLIQASIDESILS